MLLPNFPIRWSLNLKKYILKIIIQRYLFNDFDLMLLSSLNKSAIGKVFFRGGGIEAILRIAFTKKWRNRKNRSGTGWMGKELQQQKANHRVCVHKKNKKIKKWNRLEETKNTL